VDNRLGSVIEKYDGPSFDNNYLRRRFINCLDYILCIFPVWTRMYVVERNGTMTDKKHNGKLDADRLLP